MNLKNQIILRKVNKLRKEIEKRFEKTEQYALIITPRINGWPEISKNVAYLVKGNDWWAYPLVVNLEYTNEQGIKEKREVVEFIIAAKYVQDAWTTWKSMLNTCNKNQDKLSDYQRFVHNHMCKVSEDFKKTLEAIGKCELSVYVPPLLLAYKKDELQLLHEQQKNSKFNLHLSKVLKG